MKNLTLILFILLSSCSNNILSETGSSNADEEFYAQALAELNDENYDAAILTSTTRMSASGQSQVRSRELLASAYAGKCGLNFVEYTSALAAQTTGSAMFIMMFPFVGRTADPDACLLSLQTMELIGATEARTANQNLFTSVVGMVLMGSALRIAADVAPVNGDGTKDVDVCTAVSDAQIDQMILGFGFFNKNYAAVSTSLIGGHSGGSLDGVTAACNSTVGAALCQVIDPSQITPAMRSGYRDLINTADYGIGAVVTGGDPMLISAACP